MKKFLVLGALISALLAGDAVHSKEGGNVGPGTGNIYMSQTCGDRGGMGPCLDLIAGLLSTQMGIALSEGHDFAASREDLVTGLVQALNAIKSWPVNDYPLTAEALQRGIELNLVFTSPDSDTAAKSQEDRRASRFLASYYNHLLNKIIPLDINYYIPSYNYVPGYGSGLGYDSNFWDAFVVAYRDAAVELMDLYVGRNGGGLPETFALDDYETKAAELVFKYVADDLSRDDFRRFFRFEYVQLRQAQARLAIWNAPQGKGFPSSKHAVYFSRAIANGVRDQISKSPCQVTRETIDAHLGGRRGRGHGGGRNK